MQFVEASPIARYSDFNAASSFGKIHRLRVYLREKQAQWIAERRALWERRLDGLGVLLDAQDKRASASQA